MNFINFDKVDTVVVLKHILTQVQNIYSTTTKTLIINNDSEFFSYAFQTLLYDLGVAHQSTYV